MGGEHTRRHDEHARVPQVARHHVAGSGPRIRLLHKLGDPAGATLNAISPGLVAFVKRRAGRDVSVGGRGLGGRQADSHDVAVASGTNRRLDGTAQELRTGDQMVSREGTDDRVVPKAFAHDVGGQANRGHGIATRRLDEKRAIVGGSKLGQLGEYTVTVRLAGHDTHRRGHPLQAVHRTLQEGAARARQVEEELGTTAPRQRPQAGASSAGGNNHVEVTHAPSIADTTRGRGTSPAPSWKACVTRVSLGSSLSGGVSLTFGFLSLFSSSFLDGHDDRLGIELNLDTGGQLQVGDVQRGTGLDTLDGHLKVLGDGRGGGLHEDGELLNGVHGARNGLANNDNGDLNIDLLAGLNGQEVGVQDVAAHGVNLNVLNEGQLGLAVDLQLNEGVLGAADDEEEVVAGNVQVTGLGAVAVEDRGDLTSAAGAAGSTLTKLGTLFGKQDGVVAHVSFLRFSGPASVSAE